MSAEISDRDDSGRYHLKEAIGRGGMAEVLRAYDEVAELDVAIKVLHSHLVGDEALREAFERESEIMQRLEHPAIVRVHSMTSVVGRPAIVMDLHQGGDLRRRLMRRGKLSEDEAVAIAEPILDALSYLHQRGIIHRDIKPHNILIDDQDRPLLIDFGIGQSEEVAEVGAAAQLGTVEYMAPERIDGLAIDGRSDLYSLGIMLFELVCGHVPFRADSPAAVMRMHRQDEAPNPRFFESELSKRFAETIERALQRHPEERWQRAPQMSAALRGQLEQQEPIQTHARWERLCEEFGEETSLVASSGDNEEWVVFIRQDDRIFGGLLDFQCRAITEIVDAYPEHQTDESVKGSTKTVSIGGIAVTSEATQSIDPSRNSAIARGLSRQGAEKVLSRLAKVNIPARMERRDQAIATSPLTMASTTFIVGLTWVFFGLVIVAALPLWTAGVALISVAFATGVPLGFVLTGNRGQEWYLAHKQDAYLLDFRIREEAKTTPLIDIEHVELVERIRSPRIRASLDRVMNHVLQLQGAFKERGVAAEDELRQTVTEVSQLAEAIIGVEVEVAQVRPTILVKHIDELDRRIATETDLDATEELMEQKADLRRQLADRDLAQQRLQALAQRLLEVAGDLEDLLRRWWDSDEGADVEMLTALDFDIDERHSAGPQNTL